MTYAAPFTFPWLDTGASEGSVGVKFTAGRQGVFLYSLMLCMSGPCCSLSVSLSQSTSGI